MFNFGYRKYLEIQHSHKYFTSAVSEYWKELLAESQLVSGMTFQFATTIFASNPTVKYTKFSGTALFAVVLNWTSYILWKIIARGFYILLFPCFPFSYSQSYAWNQGITFYTIHYISTGILIFKFNSNVKFKFWQNETHKLSITWLNCKISDFKQELFFLHQKLDLLLERNLKVTSKLFHI